MHLILILLIASGLGRSVTPECRGTQDSELSEPTKPVRSDSIVLPAGLTAEEVDDGWVALFDDHSSYGWKAESDVDWKFDHGLISAQKGQVGLLRTTSQFDRFILKLDFRGSPETNSGVFIRTSPKPKNPAGDCYEINIAPASNPFPSGSLVARKKSTVAPLGDKWNRLEIRAKANVIEVILNGKQACLYQDSNPLGRGYIGLQFNSGKIAFRNIKLKPLGMTDLFNGKNLDGWNTYPGMKSKAAVLDGKLNIVGGSGQIETKSSFADFVFQARCRTNEEGLNSGVFFRCIPGQKMNGYESQIQNQFLENDPTKPVDCGTGGIFRRQNARRVNAVDKKWFVKTIVAVGPHISVWVNGYQVLDWSDNRKEDINPRRGRRLKAGTIMIQGHDPTTDLSFQGIRARELDGRRPKKQR